MKRKLLFLPLLGAMAFSLTGCDFFSNLFSGGLYKGFDIKCTFASGSKEEKTAILKAVNNLGPCVNKAGTDIFPDTEFALNEDDGDYIKLTTVQVVSKLKVVFEWNVDQSQPTFEALSKSDDNHDIINVKFPGYGNPDTEFKWSLAKATCGGAVTKDTKANYKVTLKGEAHPHEAMTIAQVNKVTKAHSEHESGNFPATFDLVNYDQASPYFIPNPDDPNPNYRYVKVKGKVVYYAPDGNWLLIGDGNQFLEVYAGKAYNLKPSEFPAISNEWVEVHGNLSQYKGNIQIGFVTKILPLESHADVAEPDLTGRDITSSFITSNFEIDPSYGYACQLNAIDGFSNSIGKISGTVDASTLKDGDGKDTTIDKIGKGARFSFAVNLEGGKSIVVAYDYHTDKTNGTGVFASLKSKLTSGGSISVKGTMRYNGNDENPFTLSGNPGVWNIVPFDVSHIS